MKGAAPNLEALTKIVRATGCDANWLLTGEGHDGVPGPTAEQQRVSAMVDRLIDALLSARAAAMADPDLAQSWVADDERTAGDLLQSVVEQVSDRS